MAKIEINVGNGYYLVTRYKANKIVSKHDTKYGYWFLELTLKDKVRRIINDGLEKDYPAFIK